MPASSTVLLAADILEGFGFEAARRWDLDRRLGRSYVIHVGSFFFHGVFFGFGGNLEKLQFLLYRNAMVHF